MRATIEKYSDVGCVSESLPPINISVVLGQENLSIKALFYLINLKCSSANNKTYCEVIF